MTDEVPPGARRTTTIQLGRLKLTGWSAQLVLLVILAAIVGLLVFMKPALSNWPSWTSAALWILFIGYWSAAAKNASATSSSESRASRRVHERLMNTALLLLFVPIPGLRQQLWAITLPVIAAGLSLQVASGMFGVWARRHLGRNWSGAITIAVDHHLVRSGPYARVRHPIYTAMLGMFAATAIISGTPHALMGVAVIAYAYWRKIPLEEANLRGVFGAAYDEYRRMSGALLPRLTRPASPR